MAEDKKGTAPGEPGAADVASVEERLADLENAVTHVTAMLLTVLEQAGLRVALEPFLRKALRRIAKRVG
jgi:hypothetical protein